jgi:hypothetical protein
MYKKWKNDEMMFASGIGTSMFDLEADKISGIYNKHGPFCSYELQMEPLPMITADNTLSPSQNATFAKREKSISISEVELSKILRDAQT